MKPSFLWVVSACGLISSLGIASESTPRRVWRADTQSTVDIELRESFPFAKDFRLVEHGPLGARTRDLPKARYWVGRTLDGSGSEVMLIQTPEGAVDGYIQTPKDTLRLSGDADAITANRINDTMVRAWLQRVAKSPSENGMCSDQLPIAPEDPRDGQALQSLTPDVVAGSSYGVRLAIDTDFELYQKLGSSAALQTYVGGLIASISSIYEGEVNTEIQVTHLEVRSTSSDPWSETTPACQLYAFGREWNNNYTGITRSTAHMLSGKTPAGGGWSGIAWVGVLCSSGFSTTAPNGCASISGSGNFGGGYGTTFGMSGNNSFLSIERYVVGHELGHNFNSPHTHCYGGLNGNASPIDQCFGSETTQGSTCHAGATSLPGPAGAGSGTLMSYCHLLSPGNSNITQILGAGHPYGVAPERVPNRMLDHLAARASSSPSCLAPFVAAPEADLSSALTINQNPAPTGSNLIYTTTVSNAAGGDPSTPTVSVTLPAGVSYSSATGSGFSCSHSSGTVTCAGSSALAAGNSRSATVTVALPANYSGGANLSASATVSGSVTDTNAANNTATLSTPVQLRTDLSAALSINQNPAPTGNNLVYTATVSNASGAQSSTPTLSLSLPAGVSFSSATGSGFSCSHSSGTVTCAGTSALASGSNRAATISVALPSNYSGSSPLSATATVSGSITDSNTANNTATLNTPVQFRTDLSVALSINLNPAPIGSPLTYTLTAINMVAGQPSTPTLNMSLPAGVTYQNASGSGYSCTHSNGTVTCSGLSALAAGSSRAATVNVLLPANYAGSANLSANAIINGSIVDPNSANNSVVLSTPVQFPGPDDLFANGFE